MTDLPIVFPLLIVFLLSAIAAWLWVIAGTLERIARAIEERRP